MGDPHVAPQPSVKRLRIAVYPGDGIGPDVIFEAVRALRAAVARHGGPPLELVELPWGAEFFRQTGRIAPDDFLDVLRPFDAILLGALGWPSSLPDHLTLAPLVALRQRFDQYACVRPARLFAGLRSPLADKRPADIDMIVVRENSEGEYADNGGRVRQGTPHEFAVQTAVHTRCGVERILRFGFALARTRRKSLTMITKSNALRHAYVLWDDVLAQIASEYSDVAVERQHADAAAMNMVRRPEMFDVVVASNLFGDILTDLAGTIAGGLGLAPSANINPERRFPSMFEPVHGSAPDIAGQGVANPTAAVLSAAMMLEWLDLRAAADTIRAAVTTTLSAGHKTADLGGRLSTREMGDRFVAAIEADHPPL